MNKSAWRAVKILEYVSKSKKPLTITEISKAMELPKSSTFELLYTLMGEGFLEMESEELKTFRLGIKAFEVGAAFITHTDLHKAARPLIEGLMAKSGETVFLAVEDKGSMVYLDKAESQSSIRTTCVMGSRIPMYCTGLGKALLAAYPADRVKEITGGGDLAPFTPYTLRNYDKLAENLEQIRQRGYSVDNRESEMEIMCVAAPVYDRLNKPIAAISIAGPYSKMEEKRFLDLSRMVVETALEVSRRLGFLGNQLYMKG